MHEQQDCLKKIVAQGRSPLYTQVGQIMTDEVILCSLIFNAFDIIFLHFFLWMMTRVLVNRITW